MTIKNVQVIKATKNTSEFNEAKSQKIVVSPYVRVSTGDEEQLGSYNSQIEHYTNLILNNPEWELGDVYADEGISGTQVKKRNDFKRMIEDALKGSIDLIITKSISRFARNTEDTLRYVRRLKEVGVAVFFEKENINTLTMDGELLLTILSSLAQQESESISANVKMGITMKMKRGEMVGRQRCLGYDYDKDAKQLTVNEKEAEIVRYIFKRYLEGVGGYIIAKELTANPDWYTIRGNKTWEGTSVIRIVKNEKYTGDLLLGKTITVDSISHRRIANLGEEEQYLVQNHHEPIISREVFEKVQNILSKRSVEVVKNIQKRNKYSRKHAFSSITRCGYCGSWTTRRRWHKGKPYEKFTWVCFNYLRNGKCACDKSKGVNEQLLQEAFVKTFNNLKASNLETLQEFMDEFSESFKNNDHTKELKDIDKEIKQLNTKLEKLVDMRLDDIISKSVYEVKHSNLSEELNNYKLARTELENANIGEATIIKRIKEIKKILSQHKQTMIDFDRNIFEQIISEVVLGAYNKEGEYNPYTITFKLKAGVEYVSEILFDETKTGGKKPYVNSGVNTCSCINRDTLLTFDFAYDFGYSIYKNHRENNGNVKIEVIVVI